MHAGFRANERVIEAAANVRAFLTALHSTAGTGEKAGKLFYQPEELAEILYFHPQTVADAMYYLGLLDRRQWDRRTKRTVPARLERRRQERRHNDDDIEPVTLTFLAPVA